MNQEEYLEYCKEVLEILEKSRKETKPYIYNVLGKDFVILPNVFSPKYFDATEVFGKDVPKRAGDTFLEIGTGTGIVACLVGLKSDNTRRIVATDINPEAVKNAKINSTLYELERVIEVRHGDVYEPVGDEKFDTILWNVPFEDYDDGNLDILKIACFDPGYKNLRKFISGARNHLKHKDSNLLIGFSKTLGKYEVLEDLLVKHGFQTPITIAKHSYTREKSGREIEFQLFETSRK